MNVIRLPADAGQDSDAMRLGSEFLQGCVTPNSIIERATQHARTSPEIATEILLCATQRLVRNPQALLKLIEHVSAALDETARRQNGYGIDEIRSMA